MHLDPPVVEIPGPSGHPQIARRTLREIPKAYTLDAPGNKVPTSFKYFHSQ